MIHRTFVAVRLGLELDLSFEPEDIALTAGAFAACKIARNTDPLRGDIASNSDPF